MNFWNKLLGMVLMLFFVSMEPAFCFEEKWYVCFTFEAGQRKVEEEMVDPLFGKRKDYFMLESPVIMKNGIFYIPIEFATNNLGGKIKKTGEKLIIVFQENTIYEETFDLKFFLFVLKEFLLEEHQYLVEDFFSKILKIETKKEKNKISFKLPIAV